MKDGKISKLVMAIISKDTGEVLERWRFDIHVFGQSAQAGQASRDLERSEKENQTYDPIPLMSFLLLAYFVKVLII